MAAAHREAFERVQAAEDVEARRLLIEPQLVPWPELVQEGQEQAVLDRVRWREARGWPRPALWCEYEVDGQGNGIAARGGITLGALPPWSMSPNTVVRALPLRPLWSGLAVDTAVYGFLWWTVLVGSEGAKRFRRRAWGLCLTCGYDTSGAPATQPCPECGTVPASPSICGHESVAEARRVRPG